MALQKIPGLIDIHVHLRDPGATEKEDFRTGTEAAVAGGFTCILDMPNNPTCPTISTERLNEKAELVNQKALCDVGFHFGTDGKNLDSFATSSRNLRVFGLKVYCGKTTGDLLVADESVLDSIYRAWESPKPILLHAEGDLLEICLALGKKYERRVHVCHVSTISDLALVKRAKEKQTNVTAGVTPHHLFLTEADVKKLGAFGLVKPPIGDEETRLGLWEGLKIGLIDLIESDHAPHTKKEKLSGAQIFGVPGLETTLGLFCRAVYQKRASISDVIRWVYETPKKIFNIPDQNNTFVELDPSKPFIVGEEGYKTKCGWSPFDGWELFGKVETVVLRKKPLVVGSRLV